MTHSETTALVITCIFFGIIGFILGALLPLWAALLIAIPVAWFGSEHVYNFVYLGEKND